MTAADRVPDDHPFSRPTAADLRGAGSLKWTAHTADVAAWVAEADFGTAPAVAAALREAVERGLTGYLPPGLRADLAEACAEWHARRYGWHVDPARVQPVADVLEALRVTVEHLTPAGAPVILPTPAYMPFRTAPRLWGREVIEVPMAVDDAGRWTPDLDGLETAFGAGGHLLVLVNPHNPTGSVLARDELAALAELVERCGGRVFADEIHAPLTLPGARHVPYASVSDAAAAHSVTATSASKAWNIAGLKCAQLVLTSDADAARWPAIDHVATHGAGTLGVLANTVAFRDGEPWLDDVLDYLTSNRGLFAAALAEHAPAARHTPAEGTYLAWVDLRATPVVGRGRDLARLLLSEAGLAVVDGAACGAPGEGFVRVNLAMPGPLVEEAARRLGAVAGTAP